MMWREQGKSRYCAGHPSAWFRARKVSGTSRPFAALRQLTYGRTAHRIDVIGARKGTGPDLLRIAFDRLLNRRSQFAETLDEFRHAGRKTQHVLEHQHLAIAGDAGAN